MRIVSSASLNNRLGPVVRLFLLDRVLGPAAAPFVFGSLGSPFYKSQTAPPH